MIDTGKRKTLKLMGAASVGLATGSSALAALRAHPSAAAQLSRSGQDLSIQVISTSSVPENSVSITNQSNVDVVLEQFLPGHITFNDKLVDLNSLLTKGDIVIPAGAARAARIEVWQLLAQPVAEYVWADDATEHISHETSVTTLSAFMLGTKAVVYPEFSRNILSA